MVLYKITSLTSSSSSNLVAATISHFSPRHYERSEEIPISEGIDPNQWTAQNQQVYLAAKSEQKIPVSQAVEGFLLTCK
jgi:hypothetical protein